MQMLTPTHESLSLATRARRTCLAAAAALLLTPLAHTATAAQPPSQATAQTVTYRDLDISSAAGASLLLRRIEAAARLVCGDLDGPQPLVQEARARQCYAQAVERAVAGLHAQAVTAEYLADFGAVRPRFAPRS
jgi:UrcA family protein